MENVIFVKSQAFANRIIKAYQYLKSEKHEFRMSDQLLRCGTSIGALVRESQFAQSKANFINKLSVALKESNEAQYWLELLHENKYIDDVAFQSIIADAKELTAILVSIIKTSKQNI